MHYLSRDSSCLCPPLLLWRKEMQAISYTHAGLLLLFGELEITLSKPLRNMLAWLMVALLEKTAAHQVRLAEKLPDDDTQDMARRQRVRRFLSNPRLSPLLFVRPLVELIRPLVAGEAILVLILDRTEWIRRGKSVRILTVALWYQGRAIPLFRMVDNRKGNTSLEDWKAVLTPVLEALRAASWTQGKEIHLVADREYASPKLSEWVWETFRVESTLRLKRNMTFQNEEAPLKVAACIEQLQPGQKRFLRGYTVTQDSDFVMNVALSWEKGYEEPWVMMTTCATLPEAVAVYGKRFGIEPMHKDWKTNAFDLEGTRVTDPKRIETLLIPVALCMVLCVLEGDRKEQEGESLRAHKEKRTRGLFLEGLAAFTRILRTPVLARLQQFFERLFKGWLWPQQLADLLHQKNVSY